MKEQTSQNTVNLCLHMYIYTGIYRYLHVRIFVGHTFSIKHWGETRNTMINTVNHRKTVGGFLVPSTAFLFPIYISYTGWWCNNHLEKYESQWDDDPFLRENKINVPNHQPVYLINHY